MIRPIIHRFALLLPTALLLLGCKLLEPALQVEIALAAEQNGFVPVERDGRDVWGFALWFSSLRASQTRQKLDSEAT